MSGAIQDYFVILFFFESISCNLVAGPDERTHQGLVANDLDIVLHVCEMRKTVRQIRDGRDTADSFYRAVLFQLLSDEDGIDPPRGLEQREHRVEDPSMKRSVEVFGLEMFDRLRDERVVEKDRAKDGAFTLFAARQRTF